MNRTLCSVAILVATFLPGLSQAAKPFAKVNGVPVKSLGAGFLVRELKREGRPVALGILGSELVTTELLRQAAVAKGLDRRPEVKQRIQERTEDTLAEVCRGRIRETMPAPSRTEVEAAWGWVEAHALSEYEVARHHLKGKAEAEQRRADLMKPNGPLGSFNLMFTKPFWTHPEDPALDPLERRLLKEMIDGGKRAASRPYGRGGGYTVLEFRARVRRSDPVLRNPLSAYDREGGGGEEDGDDDAEGSVSFQRVLMPHLHLRTVLGRLRAAAKLAPLPASGGGWPPEVREDEEARDCKLLAAEARRLKLDQDPLVAEGLAVVRSRTLGLAYWQARLEENPITEAELRAAFLRVEGAPVAFCAFLKGFEGEREAQEGLAKLRAPGSPRPATAWVAAKDLDPRAAALLQKLERGTWTDAPEGRKGERGFLIAYLEDIRPEPGFDQALEPRRDGLLESLKDRRWDDMVGALRRAAKVEYLGQPK